MSNNKCPYCGAAVDPTADRCSYCGQKLHNESDNSNNSGQSSYDNSNFSNQNSYNQNTYNQNTYNEFQYLKPYYQEEFRKIEESNGTYKGKWNWCAFFFIWLWALTKGLWGIALVNIAINIIFYKANIWWIGLAVAIFFGVRGNYCYYNLVKNKKQFPSSL